MKVLRSTLFAATAVVLAACGDKVTVAGPATTTPAVRSVTVAPGTATLTNGASVTLQAAVTADAGATTTPLVWTSSNTAIAGVDQTGRVTAAAAPAAGSVGVCAAVGGASGCATILVVAGAGTTPATIAISSITGAGGLNAPVPVPPGLVAGQIDVRLNVVANSVNLDSVIVTIDGATAAKQTFTGAQAAALLSSTAELAAQTGTSQIVLSVNTAACGVNNTQCSATNSTTSYKNGPRAIGARAFGKFAGTTTASTATAAQSVTLNFGNANGFFGSIALAPITGQVASAVDAAGFSWKGGGVTVTATPIIYTAGLTVQSANITFNTANGPGGVSCSAGGVRGLAATAPTAPATAWTTIFVANATTAGATNVNAYEFNPAAGGNCAAALTAGGESPTITAVGSDNDNIVLVPVAPGNVTGGGGFINAPGTNLQPDAAFITRLDNVGPGGVAGTFAANGRTGSWLNDAVVLNGLQTGFAGVAAASTSANGVVTAGADLGSGRVIGTATGVVFTARSGLAADATATVDANTPITSIAALAESANNATYRLRLRGTDLIGNLTSVSVGNYGADRTLPVLTQAGGPASPARNVAPGGSYTFSANDPSTAPAIGSGFFNLGANPLQLSQRRFNASATPTTFWCAVTVTYIATANANPCVGQWTSGTNPTFPSNLTFPDVQVGGGDAYFTSTATITDQAGNVSAGLVALEVVDATVGALGGLAYQPGIFVPGGSVIFNSFVSDNLDNQLARVNLQYGTNGGAAGLVAPLFDANTGAAFAPSTAAGGATFFQADFPINVWTTAFPTTLQPNFTLTATVTGTALNLQATTNANGANGAAVNVGNNLMAGNAFAMNQANTLSTPATVGIPLSAIPGAVAISNTGLAAAGPIAWVVCNIGAACANPVVNPPMAAAGNVNVSRGAATPTSVSVTAVAEGVTSGTGIFANPFSTVSFYAYCNSGVCPGAGEGWRFIGSVNSANATTDNLGVAPLGRNWYFTVTLTPGASVTPANGVYRIMAVGTTGTGVAAAQQGQALATPIAGSTVTVVP